MAVQTFIHISGTKLSDGFLPPTASSESSECCDWASICTGLNFVCVCVRVRVWKREVEESKSNRAQKHPVMRQEGGDSGALRFLHWALQHVSHIHTHTHTYVRTCILCVNKEPNPLFDSSIRPPASSNMGMQFPCLYRALWVKGKFIYICHTF